MRGWRIGLAVAGILLLGFGVTRLLTQVPFYSLKWLVIWLIAAIVIHDGVLSPVVLGVGWLLRRLVPDRGRRYLQAGLIMGAMVTVIAVPMIYRSHSQPVSKAILDQDFGGNLALLLGLIGGATLLAYAVRVARDRPRPHAAAPAPGGRVQPAPDRDE
jgi:hypothetical protein